MAPHARRLLWLDQLTCCLQTWCSSGCCFQGVRSLPFFFYGVADYCCISYCSILFRVPGHIFYTWDCCPVVFMSSAYCAPYKKNLRCTLRFPEAESLRNSVGFVLILFPLTGCPLAQSGRGRHRQAQLVDILAHRKEVHQFSCCGTAGSLQGPNRKQGGTFNH